MDDLKKKKLKHQETIHDNEDEDDEELVVTQEEEKEENKEEKEYIQEDDMDTSKYEEDIPEEEIREVSPRRDTKTPSRITRKNHLEGLIIGHKSTRMQTRRQLLYQTEIALLSHIEPNSIKEACKNENWVNAMNEELDQIEKNQTWK